MIQLTDFPHIHFPQIEVYYWFISFPIYWFIVAFRFMIVSMKEKDNPHHGLKTGGKE